MLRSAAKNTAKLWVCRKADTHLRRLRLRVRGSRNVLARMQELMSQRGLNVDVCIAARKP